MEDDQSAARRRAFLVELRELTKKHGVAIGGCGCCGSPWLNDEADVSDERAAYAVDGVIELRWLVPSDPLWATYAANIVRPNEKP